jgi:hypothetical protein
MSSLMKKQRSTVIMKYGETKAALVDRVTHEATQETLALLKALALGHQEWAAGKVKPVAEVVARLKAK